MITNKLIQKCLFLGICVASPMSFAADPHFTYEEQAIWGDLLNTDPTVVGAASLPYAVCGIGKKQSPVNITTHNVNLDLNSPATSYVAVPLSITNNGHTIKVNMPATNNPNYTLVSKEKYELLQLHFHAGSEHTVNGVKLPLEVHFVHATPEGKLAVIGVLFDIGAANAEFEKILVNAPTVAGVTNTTTLSIDPNKLKPVGKTFDGYAGSLTTPPCTEGVDWYVMRNTITVSSDQLARFTTLYYADNARVPQAFNGRITQTLNP